MNWRKFRHLAIGMPLAILAAGLMIGTSQYGYQQTSKSLSELTYTYDTRTETSTLLRDMLDAETGLRGYLLTHDAQYLQPYSNAISHIHQSLEVIRQQVDNTPQKLALFIPLAQTIQRKTAEMDLSLKLFEEGNADALKFVMFTDMGNKD